MVVLHAVETVILLLLVLVAGFAVMARRLKVPYPIVLVLAGLVISFFPRMPRVPLDPNIVFLVFLPPLLYASAWTMSWREFRRNGVVIGLLAVGLVGFTVWGVAEFSDRFITALDWKAGFLLGAVVSTTDAIAATSIAKTLGLPRRIVDILEGESLLNDATGLLALEIGIALMVRGQMPTVGAGLVRLVYLVVGGLVIGLLIGVVVGWAGAVYRRWAGGAGGEPGGSVCGVSGGRAGTCFRGAGGGGLRALYEPEEYAVFFTGGASAGERGVGGADVHAEWAGVCADWAATAVCAGGDSWAVWDGDADFLWRGVQRSADSAADGVGVSGGEDCVVCGAAVAGAYG